MALLSGVLVGYARVLDAKPCEQIGQCLSDGLASLGIASLLVPVLVLAGMLVFRFPRRDLLTALLLVLAPPVMWESLEFVEASSGAAPGSAWWLWVLVEALVVVTAWLLVRSRPTVWQLRVVPITVVVALLLATLAYRDHSERETRVAQVAAVPVTLYDVNLGDRLEVERVHASAGGYVKVHYEGHVGEQFVAPELLLVPVGLAGSACGAAEIAGPTGFVAEQCEGDPFVTTGRNSTTVGLTRGDTVLMLNYGTDTAGFDPERVQELLLSAQQVSADGLVP